MREKEQIENVLAMVRQELISKSGSEMPDITLSVINEVRAKKVRQIVCGRIESLGIDDLNYLESLVLYDKAEMRPTGGRGLEGKGDLPLPNVVLPNGDSSVGATGAVRSSQIPDGSGLEGKARKGKLRDSK